MSEYFKTTEKLPRPFMLVESYGPGFTRQNVKHIGDGFFEDENGWFVAAPAIWRYSVKQVTDSGGRVSE